MHRLFAPGRALAFALAIAPAIFAPRAAGEDLPVAKNVHVYKAYCLSCHSSSYVIQLPKTTREVWEAEVKKMVDMYDAKISPESQKMIVDYLMIVRGLPETPAR